MANGKLVEKKKKKESCAAILNDNTKKSEVLDSYFTRSTYTLFESEYM